MSEDDVTGRPSMVLSDQVYAALREVDPSLPDPDRTFVTSVSIELRPNSVAHLLVEVAMTDHHTAALCREWVTGDG